MTVGTGAAILKGSALVLGACVLSLPIPAQAQFGNNAIARTYSISGEVAQSGDLISFDRVTQGYRLSNVANDRSLLGVVVSNPVLVLRTIAGGVPIVGTGEAYVNVTTVNGVIAAGDYITSSVIPGKGQKASATSTFVVGTALEGFPKDAASVSGAGGSAPLAAGSVRVLLAIGAHEQPVVTPMAAGGGTTVVEEGAIAVSTPISRVIKYVLASVIVFGTIYLAFKNFTANLKDSVVSIGRNPLAKASIQSMTVLNTTLIVVVSAVGLFIGLMILFLPL